MKTALLLAFVAGAASAPVTRWRGLADKAGYGFEHFELEFGKRYGSPAARAAAMNTFNRNLAQIHQHNRRGSSWVAGVNQFTDITPEELSRRFKGLAPGRGTRAMPRGVQPTALAATPDAVDWRQKNVVSPVKNQQACGSCWAHSVVESVESCVAIGTGKLLELAPQELVDCMPNPDHCGGSGGCAGATTELGFAYTMLNGLTAAANYTYTAKTGTCLATKPGQGSKRPVAGVASFTRLPSNDYDALLQAVATAGPVSISVDASWGSYESGIFAGCNKTSITIDHAVQLVGYGTDNGHPFWLVRNSWGAGWGEEGYIRLDRANKACGVDSNPLDGNGCKGGKPEMTVCGECGILSDSAYPTGGFLF